MKKLLFIVLVFFVAADGWAQGSWRDKAQNLKEKAGNAKEKVKGAASKVRDEWQGREGRCEVCGKVIHTGRLCLSCRKDRAVDFMKQRGPQIAEKMRAESQKVRDLAMSKYGDILDKVVDPKTRETAVTTVGTVLRVRGQIRDARRKFANNSFDGLAAVPLPGGTTLGEFASRELSKKYPKLAKTGVFDDPAETATAIMCHDCGFFLGDVKLLKGRDGQNVSVYGAIKEASPFDNEKLIKCLKVAEATEDVAYTVQTGEDADRAVSSVLGAIETFNKGRSADGGKK